MKIKVRRLVIILVVAVLFLFLTADYFLQIYALQQDMVRASENLFSQIEQVVEENETELGVVKEELRTSCILRARAAAYILQQDKSKIKNPDEINKIASLLEVDEIHVFNESGTLYAGNKPKYYGYNFYSGNQLKFFQPMLEDKTLSLCQEITPNTAEYKMMQYAACWMEDGSSIVQIGLEPERVMEQTKKNEISYVFSLFATDDGSALLAINPETYAVSGSTDPELLGKRVAWIGIEKEKMTNWGKGFYAKINGRKHYCVFEKEGSMILGRVYDTRELFRGINGSNVSLFVYLTAIALVMITAITRYLEIYIISSISEMKDKLQAIADGNLDERVDVNKTPEFTELSGYINRMVESILESTDKMSEALESTDLPIGIFEYNLRMTRVRATSKVAEVLNLSSREAEELLGSRTGFDLWMQQILAHPLQGEKNIYVISETPSHYVEIERFVKEDSVFGILVDRTADILKKMHLERELAQDDLTKLRSRRGFFDVVNPLFADPHCLKHAAAVMIDADGLKRINDTYGHDRGDQYLREIGNALTHLNAPEQITARLSGDEFAIFLYGMESRADLDSWLEQLKRSRTESVMTLDTGEEIHLSFSFGVGYYLEDGTDFQLLLQAADQRMYEDKKQRKVQREV